MSNEADKMRLAPFQNNNMLLPFEKENPEYLKQIVKRFYTCEKKELMFLSILLHPGALIAKVNKPYDDKYFFYVQSSRALL